MEQASKSRVVRKGADCPYCGSPIAYDEVRYVRAGSDPGLRRAVLDGSVSKVFCGRCSNTVGLAHPVFYSDERIGLLALLAAELPVGPARVPLDKMAADAPAGTRLRHCPSLEDLQETIRILESGLDDRAVRAIAGTLSDSPERAGAVFRFACLTSDEPPAMVFASGPETWRIENGREAAANAKRRLGTPDETTEWTVVDRLSPIEPMVTKRDYAEDR